MKKITTILTLLFASISYGQAVVINELDCDTPGIDYGEFIDAAFVATNQKSRKKTRWGKRNPLRSISPVRRAGGGFRYGR